MEGFPLFVERRGPSLQASGASLGLYPGFLDDLRVELELAVDVGRKLRAVAGDDVVAELDSRPAETGDLGVDVVIPAFLIIVLGGVGSFWGAVIASILVGLAVGITGAYAPAWSMMSMYLLLIAVVSFRARGLFGRKSALEA